jgi:hypothetical protein
MHISGTTIFLQQNDFLFQVAERIGVSPAPNKTPGAYGALILDFMLNMQGARF